jgi:hypothetical protein
MRQKFWRMHKDIKVLSQVDCAFDQGLTASVCWLDQEGH